VSPTVFQWRGYRFYFFSREEPRMHVHVVCADGEAKFWLEPDVEVVKNHHLTAKQVSQIEAVVKERKDEICNAWRRYFPGRSNQR
jgi:hypothetical protein